MKIYIQPTADSEQHDRDVAAAAQSLTNEDLGGETGKKLARLALDHRRDYASQFIPTKAPGYGLQGAWLLRSTTYENRSYDVFTVDNKGDIAMRAGRIKNPDLIEIKSPNKRSMADKRYFAQMNAHLRRLARESADKMAGKIADQLEWDDDRRNRLAEKLHAIERARMKKGFREFLARLDAGALETARRMGFGTTQDLNWLNAGGDGAGRDNRRRVVESLGVLSPLITGTRNNVRLFDEEQTARARRFFKTAQTHSRAGTPFMDDMRAVLSLDPARPITPSTMKLLRKFRHTSPRLTHDLWLAVPHIDALPPELRPKTQPELRRAVATITACRNFLTQAMHATRGDRVQQTREDRIQTQMNIRDRLPGLVKTSGGWDELNTYFNGIAGGAGGLRDWNAMIVNHIVIPYAIQRLLAEGHDVRDCISQIFNGHGFTVPEYAPLNRFNFEIAGTPLRDMLDASSRWHGQMGAYEAKLLNLAKDIPTLTIDPLSAPLQAPNGLWITPLVTRASLSDEGAKQNHCVATKWPTITLGSRSKPAFIVSVSADKERTQRISTATLVGHHEIEKDRGFPDLRVEEHQGHGNRTPQPEAAKALTWYIAHMAKMDRAHWAALVASFARRRKENFENQLVQLCGYDPFEYGKTRAIFDGALRFYMPGRQKTMGFDEWVMKSGLKAFVDKAIEHTFTQYPELRLRRAA